MKNIFKLLLAILSLYFVGCDKVDDIPFYGAGNNPILTASTNVITPAPADSNNTALTLSWTFAKHSTDSSRVKYVIEIDSNANFASARTYELTALSKSFTNKELNALVLGYGYGFSVPVDLKIRVFSSYSNNNERLASNTVTVKFTTYKVPPKVPLPATSRLFIVGDATTFGWSNDPAPPAFPAAREFARLDETTWGAIMYMNGTGAYKLLQTQGNWSTQFHMIAGGTALSGSFEQRDADPGFPSPAAAGWYNLLFDFQSGKYTLTPFANPLAQELYLTGDATAAGWVNNPPAAQKFTRLNSVEYEITYAFVPGKFYKFLSSFNNWQPQFGGSSATGGTLGANYGSSSDPAAVPTPAAAGTYKVRVNFFTNSYKVGT